MVEVRHVQMSTEALRDVLHDLLEEGLRITNPLTMCVRDWELAEAALELLRSDAPLQETYPDGTRAEPPFTYKQVFLLARRPFVTPTEEVSRHVSQAVRRHLGRREPRRCGAETTSGSSCRSYCLSYEHHDVMEVDRRCRQHAQRWQVEHNAEVASEEKDLLYKVYERLAEYASEPTLDDAKHVLKEVLR